MKKRKKLKFYTLNEVMDEHIGLLGTPERDAFEEKLKYDIFASQVREARLQRNLTQQQLGELVGVQKAQISKLENSLTDARFDTVMKVFRALNAKVNFSVEMLSQG